MKRNETIMNFERANAAQSTAFAAPRGRSQVSPETSETERPSTQVAVLPWQLGAGATASGESFAPQLAASASGRGRAE